MAKVNMMQLREDPPSRDELRVWERDILAKVIALITAEWGHTELSCYGDLDMKSLDAISDNLSDATHAAWEQLR